MQLQNIGRIGVTESELQKYLWAAPTGSAVWWIASVLAFLPSLGIFLWSQWLLQSATWRPFLWEWGATDTAQHPCGDSPQHLRRHLHPGPLLHLQRWYRGEASHRAFPPALFNSGGVHSRVFLQRPGDGFINTALVCYFISVLGTRVLGLAVSFAGRWLMCMTFRINPHSSIQWQKCGN